MIQVPRPAMPEFRPGGIGLSDLESYLDAGFRHRNLQLKNKAPEIETDSSTFELMDVKLERASTSKERSYFYCPDTHVRTEILPSHSREFTDTPQDEPLS